MSDPLAARVAARFVARGGAKKPNPADQANAVRWETGGRKRFVQWAERTFLPAFQKAVDYANSVAGELFGESVFDDFLKLVNTAPELREFSRHFGYPASGAKDDELMSMWSQDLASLRLRQSGGKRAPTPIKIYQREFETLSGIVHALKALR